MSYFVAIVCFALALLLNKKWGKWNKWWLVAPLVIIGSGAFANTEAGAWVAGLLGDLIGFPASWMGASASLLATAAVIILIPMVVYGYIHDHRADKTEMAGTVLLPLLFIVAAGPLAVQGATLFDSAAAIGTNLFGGFA